MILRHPGLDPLCQRWVRAVGALGLAVLLVSIVATCSLFRSEPPARPLPLVDVLLASRQDVLEVQLDGPYELTDARGGVLATGGRLAPGRFQAAGNGLDLNGLTFATTVLRVRPLSGDRFSLGDRRYAGTLTVQRDESGRVEATNRLDIEQYVAGVLFAEMPGSFPEEALRAQAVAARSYARWKLQGGGRLRATESDQVYRGEGTLAARARQIVESTQGQVLEFQGAPLPAYFSSTCGGATGSAARVFHGDDLLPLRGRKCTWCSASPLYRWTRELSVRLLATALGLPAERAWSAVVPFRPDEYGRPDQVRIEGGGWQESLPAPALRSRWNAVAARDQQLPGAWLHRVQISGDRLQLEGAGFGHGVGLCQYGAKGLAEAGQDHRRILAYYYGGADLVRRW